VTSEARPPSPPTERGTVIVLISDLFFSVNIRVTLRRLGYNAVLTRSIGEVSDGLASGDVRLVVVDGTAVDTGESWERIGQIAASGIPVLVFGPHKEVETLRAAKMAGVTRVVANSQFHREMPVLVERYALNSPSQDGDAETNE